MSKKKVLVLVHSDLIPPQDISKEEEAREDFEYKPWITEYNVIKTLKSLGHNVKVVGLYSDLMPLREAIDEFKPNIVFNLLEEFNGNVLFDQNVVSYLELLKVKYTGNNPRGLMIARDKAMAKKLLSYHRIKTPQFQVFKNRKKTKLSKKLKFPLIVKCLYQDASLGISGASIVKSEEKALERIKYLMDKYEEEVIVEEFIEGREFFVGVIGNKRLTILPILELRFNKVDKPELELYSEKAKWNMKYRKSKGIDIELADIPKEVKERIIKICKRTYKVLELNGYARIDLRVDENGIPYIIEANPNPNIAMKDEFAMAAESAGISYKKLITKLVN
ncbi:ATP-grasp domain-containing protein [Halobacteriovorax vibrionivorans]|uniref:ATP-grasp domain-containing protein n=1 Tax=Halobacteriovorax vibrionivorans TaxID=2152716 RepID=A0ABY0ILS7_9BACT|nr:MULTISPECIES: ATP-grasp domain-containing protein [Halobacteriovorax]RZF22479.1 ATP-grasp domain-containing protein [Halobacteriovorax vibrionivorans]TGD47670.1 ATP-grasp domain-containing protein [Halobacteriovorax sp. Y22]